MSRDLVTYRGTPATFGRLGMVTPIGLADNEASPGHGLDGPFMRVTTDDVQKARQTCAERFSGDDLGEVLSMLGIDTPGLEAGIARGVWTDLR